MCVCALRVTESARQRIIDAGGEVLTLDQLALKDPKGENTALLKGPVKSQKKYRYFGGKPYTESKKGTKVEQGRHRKIKRNKKYRKTN